MIQKLKPMENNFGAYSTILFMLLHNYCSYKEIRATLSHKKEIEFLSSIIEVALQDAKMLGVEINEDSKTSQK